MFERMNKQKKLERARELFLDAVQADSHWQLEARDDFLFRDGAQWTTEEKRILEDEKRPVLVFNLTKSSIDLVMGMNEDNRIRHRCSPVEPTDGFLCEVLNDIDEWIMNNEEFEEEEDDAFESSVICGRGWVAVDFVPDTERFGSVKLTEVSVPVHEIHFDPSGRRTGGQDWGLICWDRWMSKADFKIRYPKMTDQKIEALKTSDNIQWGDHVQSLTGESSVYDNFTATDPDTSDFQQPVDTNFYDRARDLVRVVHMEYWEPYKRFFAWNPAESKFVEFDGSDLKTLKDQYLEEFGEELQYETLMDKKVKWIQFAGDNLLYDGDSPLPYNGFSIVPIITFRDMSKRTSNHYGLVRLIKDPQKEVNKRWSQALHILAQQVQSGVYAETSAFVDDRQAEQSLKETGSITWVRPGAISGQKFLPRDIPKFPNAPMQMQEFSQDIMKKITGINPDLLGQDRGRQEAGVVIRLRQQQGITLLKPLFKAYNKAKKEIFKRRLAIIMSYMPDEQILNILGQGDRYSIAPDGVITDNQSGLTANIRDLRNVEYNISAEEAPGNMTKRMMELSMLMELMQAGMQVDPMAVIDKLEMPANDKLRWQQYLQAQQEAQQKMVEEQIQREMEVEDRKIAVDETGNMMDFIVDMAKIKQMAEKDDKKQMTDFVHMSEDRKKNLADFIVRMSQVMATAEAAKQKAKEGTSNGRSK